MKPFKCKTCSRSIDNTNYFTVFSHHNKDVWHICAECSARVLKFNASVFDKTKLVSSKTVRTNGKKHILEVWELPN